MARKKISDLDDGGVLAAGDYILIARDGANYKMNGSQIANTVANVANNAASLATVSTTVSTHTSDLSGIKTRLDTVEAANGNVANVANTLTSITGRVSTLEGNVANTATTLANVASRVTTLESSGGGGTPVSSGSAAHRYWRFVCLDSTNAVNGQRYFAIAEVEMRAAPTGSDLCTGGTAIARNAYTGSSAASAFDDNLTTIYETGGDVSHQPSSTAGVGNWIGYDFGTPVAINVLTLKNNGSLPNERIVSGVFQNSDDGTLYKDAWNVTGLDTGNNSVSISVNPNYTTTSAAAPRLIRVRPPTATTFPTVVNATGGGTNVIADDAVYAIWRTDTGNSDSSTARLGGRFKPISGTSWSATLSLKQPFIGLTSGSNLRVGMMARESSSGKIVSYHWGYSGSGFPFLGSSLYASAETNSPTLLLGALDMRHSDDITIRLIYNSSASVNFTYMASTNYGRTWQTIGQGSASMVPDQIGIGLITIGTSVPTPRVAMDVFYYSDPDTP